jgi:hypothetical protein
MELKLLLIDTSEMMVEGMNLGCFSNLNHCKNKLICIEFYRDQDQEWPTISLFTLISASRFGLEKFCNK